MFDYVALYGIFFKATTLVKKTGLATTKYIYYEHLSMFSDATFISTAADPMG